MQLKELIFPLDHPLLTGELDRQVMGIAFDSRQVRSGTVFVAIAGTQVDGHDYLEAAVNAGAVAVVVEKGRSLPTYDGVTTIAVTDTAEALAVLAEQYHGNPSRSLQLVGITGTNGKTTVASLLHQLFTDLGYVAGLLSTVAIKIGVRETTATHTTPDAVAISAALAEMRDAGVDYAFMEVSSHAVHQRRTAGLHFAGGVFTNLTHDHLDYHGTFDAYLKAKKRFFDELPAGSFALTNADDRHGSVMVQNTKAEVSKYSLRSLVGFRGRMLSNTVTGLQLDIDGTEVYFKLVGRYNAYNLLAVYATARLLGQESQESLIGLSTLDGPAGRLQRIDDPNGSRTFLVDYAHTPDALDNVLAALRVLMTEGQRLICVVGAGGDRDRTKRPVMATVAARLADEVILTSDNPRSEDPNRILDEMEEGLTEQQQHRVIRITDRREAIRSTIRHARPGSVVLIAGKGHETYQEIAGEKLPFDDRTEIVNALNLYARAH